MHETTARRLAFIKYLWRRADEAVSLPEPLCGSALLGFHDAVEFFLQVASETTNNGSKSPSFLDYWDLIGPSIPGGLPNKEGMRRLNKARVALKHHGTIPSRLDLQDFRTTTQDFFTESTPRVFGTAFSSLSMTLFVSPPEARSHLDKAIAALEKNDFDDCFVESATAFHWVLKDADRVAGERSWHSPFKVDRELQRYAKGSFSFGDLDSRDRTLARFAETVAGSVDELYSALRLIALGVDYHRYLRFRQITPHVNEFGDGRLDHVWMRAAVTTPTSTTALGQFAIDFVVDTALSLAGAVPIHQLFTYPMLGR